MKILLIVLATVTGIGILFEASLRLIFGLGNPPLYIADEKIGYLLAPEQNVRRMGNQIQINQYSMRSQTIDPIKQTSTLRILVLGDSIVNGGWWTDQQETISALMEDDLASSLSSSSFSSIEVLNASANSWGPRNELAYLERFGLLEAQVVILIINTDDLFATAPTSIPVGRDRNYPSSKPPLAAIELFEQVFTKPKPIPEMERVRAEKGDRVGFNLEAIQQIKAVATQNDARFILAMTPLLRELQGTGSRDYEIKARERLNKFVETENIFYIDFLPVFKEFPQPEFLYRDHIHLSPPGNRLVSETLSKFVNGKQLSLNSER
ncbi:MAG: SGNH/GDSL hydrolase family protein [Xenococcaceae cyanobacterium MO_188.B32]|nr:SGNH/GDSL hydrolase family protein [Xenococcaceae cyanobacterium MO_188.B32]